MISIINLQPGAFLDESFLKSESGAGVGGRVAMEEQELA
jgi:hypothetical protein